MEIRYTNAQIHKYANMQMHKYANTQIQKYKFKFQELMGRRGIRWEHQTLRKWSHRVSGSLKIILVKITEMLAKNPNLEREH